MQILDLVKIAILGMVVLNVLTVGATVGVKALRSMQQRRLEARIRDMEAALDGFLATGETNPELRRLRPRSQDVLALAMVRYISVLRGSERDRLIELARETGLAQRYVRRLRSRRRWRRARAAENLGYLGGRRR
jgi:hypothetical protein